MRTRSFYHLACISTVWLLTACSGQPNRPQPPATAVDNASHLHRSNKDTLVVNKAMAVFYGPDSLRLEQEQQKLGVDFYTVADDYANYLSESGMYLDSVHLQHEDAGTHRYIAFIHGDQLVQVVRPDTIPELWGLYFYKPGSPPQRVDMTNTKEEYQEYFKTGR